MNKPYNVYYVVVCETPNPAKDFVVSPNHNLINSYRYNRYVDRNGKISDRPDLLVTQAEANSVRDEAEMRLDVPSTGDRTETLYVRYTVQTVRITDSYWTEYTLDDYKCATMDAKGLVSGLLEYNQIALEIKKMAGKILTVVDAAYVNEGQNKAVKDLIKSSIKSQLSEIYSLSHRDANCEQGESNSEKDILD